MEAVSSRRGARSRRGHGLDSPSEWQDRRRRLRRHVRLPRPFRARPPDSGGALDSTLSGDGKQTTDLNGGARDLAIQPDGKIVVAGVGSTRGSSAAALARYSPRGSLDRSFSGDGKQFIEFGETSYASSVALQRDGKIVVAGGDVHRSAVLARLGPKGGLDPSFSGDGKVTPEFPDGGARDVEVQRDGKILVAGSHGYYSYNSVFAVARYLGSPGPDCTVTGSSRNDVLAGTPGDDVICVGAGNDVIRAGGGDDTVYGGPGNDVLRGDGGSDRLYGQSGNDVQDLRRPARQRFRRRRSRQRRL